MHTTVFLKEAVDALQVVPGGIYIDATFGEGGHSREILGHGGRVIGIDADPIQASKQKEITVIHGNFGMIEELLKTQEISEVDGILFDFGLSMVQLKTGGKGLSYQKDSEPLDMRLGGNGMTAEEYLNETLDSELVDQLMKYSEDLRSEVIAHAIVRYRKERQLKTVGDLKWIIDTALRQKNATDTYARIFQALRIIVNDELTMIQRGLEGALHLVKSGGNIVVISFHSLEDRVVKAFVRSHTEQVKHMRLAVHKQRALASFERSATLRVLTKI